MSREDWGVKGVGWGSFSCPSSGSLGFHTQWGLGLISGHLISRELLTCQAFRVPERHPLVLAGTSAV